MIGKKVFSPIHNEKFRHRANEVLRIEALSDAVFAFSVSLLVAALEVPQNFQELKTILQGAIPFFATVALVFLFWYQQYIFFRHYGLNDRTTILLNLVYLAVILFYIYPLKFLFSLLIGSWTGIDLFPKATEKGIPIILQNDFAALIIIFSIGYFLIWFLIYLMYRRVLHSAKELELNKYELEYSRRERRGALWNSLVGLFAILLALLKTEWLAGICYLMIPLLLFINNILFKNRLKK